ncbi:MAG: endonuclease [Clostridium sp.]|nr:endonuclease [Clostridium sp.]
MKLLTLNCHSWQEENQLEKIKYLAKTISEEKYDVITLQEVSQKLSRGEGITKENYLSVLLDELNNLGIEEYEYFWDMSHIGYDIYEEGLAILTKHKIVDKESFFVTKSTDIKNYKARKILKANISIENEIYTFFSCHLGWWHDEEESFKYQVKSLLDKVDNDKKTFLMGDFNNNAFVKDEGYDYLLSQGIYDTYKLAKEKDGGITVPGKIDGWSSCSDEKRLDLIFTNSKDIDVKISKVIFNGENKEVVSDHYGVEVIFG